MTEIEFGPNGRARVWANDLPSYAHATPKGTLSSDPIGAGQKRATIISQLAIEILYSTEPMWHYGLLGGTFVSNESSHFQAIVGYRSNSAILDPPHSLMNYKLDRLSVGLPPWAAEAVIQLFNSLADEFENLPSGVLTITHSVVAEAGSSPAILQAIGYSLAAIMSEGAHLPTANRLIEILRAGLRRGFGSGR